MANRADFAPGDAREDWAIIRALSDVLGKRLPFDSLAQLRAKLYAAHPHFAAIDEIAAGRSGRFCCTGEKIREDEQFRVCFSDQRFLSDQPDRARLGRHGRVLGAGPEQFQGRGRVRARGREHGRIHFNLCLAGLIIVGQSLLLLAVLLVFIAYILLADRKIWAAVQLRRGPNVVGPWGLLQSFADLLKFVFKEPVIPAGANKAVFLLAPLVAVDAGAGCLGRRPGLAMAG